MSFAARMVAATVIAFPGAVRLFLVSSHRVLLKPANLVEVAFVVAAAAGEISFVRLLDEEDVTALAAIDIQTVMAAVLDVHAGAAEKFVGKMLSEHPAGRAFGD